MQGKVGEQMKDENFSLKSTIAEYEKREMMAMTQSDSLQRELNQSRMQLNFANQRLQQQADAYLELQTQFNNYVQADKQTSFTQRARPPPIQHSNTAHSAMNLLAPPLAAGISVSGDRDSILPPSSVISSAAHNRPISGDSARANIGEIPMTSSRPNDISTSRTDDRPRIGYSAFLGGRPANPSEARRMPPSFSMVPGIPQQSAPSLSSNDSSADVMVSSAREQAARRN